MKCLKEYNYSLGKFFMIIGLVLCVLKASGLALSTCPWWLTSLPIWLPIALFTVFMLVILITIANKGQNK
jgi:hypothetical protein